MAEPIRLPRLLTERDAAKALGVSNDTLFRERRRGRIAFTLIGNRVRYTEAHLAEYIENRTQRCRANETIDRSSSANTGSAGATTARYGAELGSTRKIDRHAAHHSLNLILNRRS